jgi:HPt (histidine-containing phosphotransfer) domain-containing protein
MHGLFDEANQAGSTAANDQGTSHGRAYVIKEESSETDMTLVPEHPFAKLIPTYLLNCRKNIIVMRDALDRADLETVRSLGHQMSGTGAMYGLQFISDTGGAIEQAAASSNIDASRDWVGKLSNYLDDIETTEGPETPC